MHTLGKTITKKAGKATVRHTVRGFGSKAKRKPLRTTTLLGVGGAAGAAAGALAGFLVGRRSD